MPRGYRRVILAVFGCLILAASPPKNGTGSEQNKAERQIAESLHGIDASLNKVNDTGELNQPCEAEKPNRNSQLCAQWEAADQSRYSAEWAGRTFWLATVGTFIGILTLGAACAAAYFAWMAANETKASAIEAANSNLLSRATLSMHEIIDWMPERKRYFMRARYVGQTPANTRHLLYRFLTDLPPSPTWAFKLQQALPCNWAVPAGADISVLVLEEIPRDAAFLVGILRYRDATDKERTTKFRYDRAEDDTWFVNGHNEWNVYE